MRAERFGFAGSMAAALGFALALAGGPASGLTGHNHEDFKCYGVSTISGFPGSAPRNVLLEDRNGNLYGTVVTPSLLCNPVDKNGEGINNTVGHLLCYSMRTPPRATPLSGFAHDQFGFAFLDVFGQVAICNPAFKNFEGCTGQTQASCPLAQLQQELGHFECAPAQASPAFSAAVSLQDQFELNAHNVSEASFYCDPLEKKNLQSLPVPDASKRLLAHPITASLSSSPTRTVQVVDQFGLSVLRTRQPLFLVEPATKQALYGSVGKGASQVVTLDQTTGAATTLGTLPLANRSVTGLAFDLACNLWITFREAQCGSCQSQLARMDPDTGLPVPGTLKNLKDTSNTPLVIRDLAVRPGTGGVFGNGLFGVGDVANGLAGKVYRINPATGVAQFVTDLGGFVSAITFLPNDALLAVRETSPGAGQIIGLDPTSGFMQVQYPISLGGNPIFLDGLGARDDGTLFGSITGPAFAGANAGKLVTVEQFGPTPPLGAVTIVGSGGDRQLADVDFRCPGGNALP